LFFFFLDIAVINCFILKKIVDVNISHLEFRLSLIDEIVNTYGNSQSKKRKGSENSNVIIGNDQVKRKRISKNNLSNDRLDLGKHYPIVVDATHECKACRLLGKRSMTIIKCTLCNVSLCVKKGTNCWLDWHEKVRF
jgi:hypothetical protein